jgi:hypothetical protein
MVSDIAMMKSYVVINVEIHLDEPFNKVLSLHNMKYPFTGLMVILEG